MSEVLEDNLYVVLNRAPNKEAAAFDVSKTLFCLPPAGGNVFPYVRLAAHVPEFTLVVFENSSAKKGLSFDELIEQFKQTIRELTPNGPWSLCCYSLGGIYGAAVSASLVDCNLILIDAIAPALTGNETPQGLQDADLGAATGIHSGLIVMDGEGAEIDLRHQLSWDLMNTSQFTSSKLNSIQQKANGQWKGTYAVQLRAEEFEEDVRGAIIDSVCYDSIALGWDRLCEGVVCRRIPGGHFSIMNESHVRGTGRAVVEELLHSPYWKRYKVLQRDSKGPAKAQNMALSSLK